MELLLATIFVALVATFGAFLMFARPENIERPFMVGVLTLATSLVALWMIFDDWQRGPTIGMGSAISRSLLALLGFGVGRVFDMILGPRMSRTQDREATIGADLAD